MFGDSVRWVCWGIVAAACAAVSARADWIADSGYAQLSAELGAALPTGAGIVVLQTEANTGTTSNVLFMPQTASATPFAGAGNYTGKTFTVDTTAVGGYSSHADTVGTHFYGLSGSVAPGISSVHLMLADDFINSLTPYAGPPVLAGSVHNHSWIATTTGTTSTDNFLLRAFDYQINRDGIVSCVPLNNGTAPMPTFMANAYNAISAGLLSGQHSLGGSTADGTGRMKPDLVVNESETSYASPAVASCAALLRQAVKASYTAADHPQLLLAGASKTNLPAWHRASSSAPYDSTFGAGELNVLNAWHILAQGSQPASTTAEVASSGWDYGSAQSTSVKRYFFSIPAGRMGGTFSAALTWHRKVTLAFQSYNSSMSNLTLKLYAANNLVVSGAAFDQSSSTLDNVQHVFQRNLPAGEYALEVSSTGSTVNYGLAWQTQTGTGPTISVRVDATAPAVYLDCANLDPYVTYTLQQSSDLNSWTTATTLLTSATTASTTATWQDTTASLSTPKYYRLQWTPVR